MIDSYIIINRKTSSIIKFFILNVMILILLVIWALNTCFYQKFFHIHSEILYLNSHYYLEVLVPVEEVKEITLKNKILIESEEYNYQVFQVKNNASYVNGKNYQKVILNINNIPDKYKINGYQIDVLIEEKKVKLIEYLKE